MPPPLIAFAQHAIRPFATRGGVKMGGAASGLLFSAGEWDRAR